MLSCSCPCMDEKETKQLLQQVHIDDVVSVKYRSGLFLNKRTTVEGRIEKLDNYVLSLRLPDPSWVQRYITSTLRDIPYYLMLDVEVKPR